DRSLTRRHGRRKARRAIVSAARIRASTATPRRPPAVERTRGRAISPAPLAPTSGFRHSSPPPGPESGGGGGADPAAPSPSFAAFAGKCLQKFVSNFAAQRRPTPVD